MQWQSQHFATLAKAVLFVCSLVFGLYVQHYATLVSRRPWCNRVPARELLRPIGLHSQPRTTLMPPACHSHPLAARLARCRNPQGQPRTTWHANSMRCTLHVHGCRGRSRTKVNHLHDTCMAVHPKHQQRTTCMLLHAIGPSQASREA